MKAKKVEFFIKGEFITGQTLIAYDMTEAYHHVSFVGNLVGSVCHSSAQYTGVDNYGFPTYEAGLQL